MCIYAYMNYYFISAKKRVRAKTSKEHNNLIGK